MVDLTWNVPLVLEICLLIHSSIRSNLLILFHSIHTKIFLDFLNEGLTRFADLKFGRLESWFVYFLYKNKETIILVCVFFLPCRNY